MGNTDGQYFCLFSKYFESLVDVWQLFLEIKVFWVALNPHSREDLVTLPGL